MKKNIKQKNSKRKKTKYYFVLPWGTYTNDTLVFVGMSYKEMYKVLKRYGEAGQEMTKEMQKKEIDLSQLGGFVHCIGTRSLLWLSKFDGNWPCYDILLHEIHHLVYLTLGTKRNMMDECEGQAYQFEFLFRELRKKLCKYI